MSANFTISKNELQKSFLTALKSAAKMSALFPLTCVKIQTVQDENKIILTANDTEVQIKTSVETQGITGNIIFCADSSFGDALKAIPEQPIRIDVSKNGKPTSEGVYSISISIIHNSGVVKIPGFDASGFNELNPDGENTFSLPVQNLARGINKTADFAEINELKPYFGGVLMNFYEDRLVFVGSNGNNLCRYEDLSVKADAPSLIIPLKCANIIRFVTSGDSKAEITAGDKNTCFDFGGIEIISRNIDFKFPEYDHIFPSEYSVKCTVNKDEFRASLNRALSISEKSAYIHMRVGEKIELNLKNTFTEKTMTEQIESSSDGKIEIGIHAQSCKKVVDAVEGNFSFYFIAPDRPIVIRPEKDDEDTRLTILSMPINIDT